MNNVIDTLTRCQEEGTRLVLKSRRLEAALERAKSTLVYVKQVAQREGNAMIHDAAADALVDVEILRSK